MTRSTCIKAVLAIGIICSIVLSFYTKIVQEDFDVFINPDGLPELEL